MGIRPPSPLFAWIRQLDEQESLNGKLRESKLGQYQRIASVFRAAAHSWLNLHSCTVADLMKFPGVGPKTARFFILHSRPNQRLAVLDTHILSRLRELFPKARIPKSTPQDPATYDMLEALWIGYHCRAGNDDFAKVDLTTWSSKASHA